MADGRFIIAGLGSIGLSVILFLELKVFPNTFEKATTSPEVLGWLYFIHMAGAIIGVILLLIGIFKRNPSLHSL